MKISWGSDDSDNDRNIPKYKIYRYTSIKKRSERKSYWLFKCTLHYRRFHMMLAIDM